MASFLIQLKKVHHRGATRLGIFYPYDPEITSLVKKQVPDCRWSASKKMWYTGCNPENLLIVKNLLKNYPVRSEVQFLNADQEALIKKFREKLEIKRYSIYTIKSYASYLRDYLLFINKNAEDVEAEDVQKYMNDLVINRKQGYSGQNQAINAIKYFHEHILKLKLIFPALERPRKEKKLPNILSKEEVKQILNNVENVKHKLILSLLYGGGLRIGELIRLKKADIDLERKCLIIKQSKGNRDRLTLLPESVISLYNCYLQGYSPKKYVIEGINGRVYSKSSIRQILKRAVARTNIQKHVYPHTLRHSFATHLLERGVDIRYIQTLLGHQSTRTTEIYTHVSDQHLNLIKSPIDEL